MRSLVMQFTFLDWTVQENKGQSQNILISEPPHMYLYCACWAQSGDTEVSVAAV